MPLPSETPQALNEREVFAAAAALPPEERAAYLDQLAKAGRRCVRVPRHGLPPMSRAIMQAVEKDRRMHPEQAGVRIGNYRLLEKIGEGGFGVVWVADQERPVRRGYGLP